MRCSIAHGSLTVALLTASLAHLPAAEPVPAASHHTGGASPSLSAVDAAGIRQKLAAQRGKIVVLNMWATWCGPCVREFPELVKFERVYRPRGVVFMGLSIDDPSRAQQVVARFLRQHPAGFPMFILKPGDPGGVIRVFDKYWADTVPMTYIFDRSGRLRTRLSGAQPFDLFETAIKSLLRGHR